MANYKVQDLNDRIERFVERIPESGCWIWIGSLGSHGYGQIGIRNIMNTAHRVVYEFYKGEIPKGLYLDHLCRVKCCVNPNHLEPVTNRENLLRGKGPNKEKCRQNIEIARKAKFDKNTCRHGHEYTEENTRWYKGMRHCKICRRRSSNEFEARRKNGKCKKV